MASGQIAVVHKALASLFAGSSIARPDEVLIRLDLENNKLSFFSTRTCNHFSLFIYDIIKESSSVYTGWLRYNATIWGLGMLTPGVIRALHQEQMEYRELHGKKTMLGERIAPSLVLGEGGTRRCPPGECSSGPM